MEFRDFSPPAEPTLDEQRDALQKGLGRAMQWARAGCLSKDVLLEACLHEQRIDIQCEENRGEWLWNVAQAAGANEHLREPILTAFRSLTNERDAYQMCVLAGQFAHWGDGRFVDALYDIVERRPFAHTYPSIGEGQLMEVAGEPGLLFIAEIRGRLLQERSWEWDDQAIIDWAVDQFGEARVEEVLQGSTDPDVGRFVEVWKRPVAETPQQSGPSYEERMRVTTPVQVIEDARRPDRFMRIGGRWREVAKPEDVQQIIDHLWIEEDPAVLAKLLQLFWKCPLPDYDDRLISLCDDTDQRVMYAAHRALQAITHPNVRRYALQHSTPSSWDPSAISYLVRNFQPGDEQRILDCVELPDDAYSRHGTVISILNLLEQNQESDSSKLGLIVYAQTPCAECRCRAVELLVEEGIAPDWLLEECRDDSEEDCRKVVSEQNTPVEGQQSA